MRMTSPMATRPRRELSFYFTPIPDVVMPDVALGDLTSFDALVLGFCVRQRRHDGSAPGLECTKETIGEFAGKHPRTVQRSFARLKARKHLAHVPDLSDRTGYCLEFPSLKPIRLSPETVSSSGDRRSCLPPGDGRVSPPQPHSTHARSETQALETPTTNSRETNPPEPSPSSFAARGGEEEFQTLEPEGPQALEAEPAPAAVETPVPPAIAAAQAPLVDLIDRLLLLLAMTRTVAAAKIRQWVDLYGEMCVHLALTLAEIRKEGRNPFRSEGGIGSTLFRWQKFKLIPEEIREELEAARLAHTPKSTALVRSNPAAVWLETLEVAGWTYVIDPDGDLKPKRTRRDATWDGDAAGMLVNSFAAELRELLIERAGSLSP